MMYMMVFDVHLIDYSLWSYLIICIIRWDMLWLTDLLLMILWYQSVLIFKLYISTWNCEWLRSTCVYRNIVSILERSLRFGYRRYTEKMTEETISDFLTTKKIFPYLQIELIQGPKKNRWILQIATDLIPFK